MAFGDFATLLDDFNRADVGPPPSANWTDKVISTQTAGLKVVSNQLGATAATDTAWWNAATFGPDCEAYITIPTLPAATGTQTVYARLANPGVLNSTNGYYVNWFFNPGASNDSMTISRIDNSVVTVLGPTFTFVSDLAAGDKFGIGCSGTTISGYAFQSGGWGQILSSVDGTYTAAGNIGIRLAGGAAAAVADNLFAGTGATPIGLPLTAQPHLIYLRRNV